MQNALSTKFKFGSLMRYTLPSTFMMLFFAMYSTVDGMFISRFVGTDALAGLNIIYPVANLIVAITIMIASGGSAVIAKYMGQKQDRKAKEIFSMLVILALFLGGIFIIFGIVFVRELAYLLGATPETIEYAVDYGRFILYFSPLAVLQMCYQTFLVTAGKPTIGLILTILSGITNIVMDYVLVVPAQLGVIGAAIATGLGYSIPAIYCTIYFIFNKKSSLRFVRPRIGLKDLTKVITNGSSEMVVNMSMAIITMMFNIIMSNIMGADGVAAVTIIQYMQFLLTAVFMGYASGVAPVVSYKYGARDFDQQKYIFKVSMIFVGILSVLVFVFSEALAGPLVEIFAPKESPVYDLAKYGCWIFSVSYLFNGFNIFASSYFTALNNGKVSAFLSFMRTLVIIAISLIVLPILLGVTGVWLAVPIAEFLALILSTICLVGYGRRYGYSLRKCDKRYKANAYVRTNIINKDENIIKKELTINKNLEQEIYNKMK